jgi:hypothetical protein
MELHLLVRQRKGFALFNNTLGQRMAYPVNVRIFDVFSNPVWSCVDFLMEKRALAEHEGMVMRRKICVGGKVVLGKLPEPVGFQHARIGPLQPRLHLCSAEDLLNT